MVSVPGWSLSRDCLCPGRVSVQRGSLSGESLCPRGSVRETPDRDTSRTVTSGRYASYWNVFLFTFVGIVSQLSRIIEECYVLFSGAKVAQYSGINLHKQIVAEPAYGKILLSWILQLPKVKFVDS